LFDFAPAAALRDEHTNAYVNLAVYRSQNIANRFLQRAIEVRKRSGTLLNKVVVNEPEMTEATILESIGGQDHTRAPAAVTNERCGRSRASANLPF